MRTINVFVSAASDVQKESAIAEQLIRSVAAELDLPISVSYSNRLRGSTEDAAVRLEDPEDESGPVLRPFFQDCPTLERHDWPEQDQTQYDLVICLLWSRFPTVRVEKSVLANGSLPWFATNYEIDRMWGQSKRISGFQRLHVYRNRATPDFLLEPKEEREEMCWQWDAVQDFFARWEKGDQREFRECCHEYLDLEEFANLFRQHVRNFLVQQLDRGTDPNKAPGQNRFRGSNPFRGLNFFDFEHAAFYFGRTRAVGEVLDALKKQATAKKSLVLVLGPGGSGKSSLLRAGVLPLLVQGGTPVGDGPWRRVITRPGVGDPIDTLASALVAKFALPELEDAAASDESLSLASRLRKDPENAAVRITGVLGKSKTRLALVVDQLEELFIGVSPVLQRKYVTALCALARCEGIYVIAALRSDFYPHCRRFPELVNLTSGGGRYELQPPTACEIANMIRLPAEAAGLRFERDPETGRSLDDFLLKAAMNSSDPLPLLEHVLSRLYNRQLQRKDGVLLWSDYSQLGRFKNALPQHAECVFLTLNRDEQHAFKFVIRQLLASGVSKENGLVRRPVPYHELVSSPKFRGRQSAAAKSLIDCLTNEGLLSAEIDSKHCRLIGLPQDALFNNWPRLLQSLSEEQHFFEMRNRLDESLRVWLSRGSQSDHLLYDRIALAEAETLLRDFGSALGDNQIDYIKKSLARQKRHGRAPNYLGLAAIIGLAVFAVIAGVEWFISANQRNQTKEDVQAAQPDRYLAGKDTTALEARLKEAEEKLELAQQNVELAHRQRIALETELKTLGDKFKQLQDTELTDSESKVLRTQLKVAEENLKQVRANSDETSTQLSTLQVQLKQEQDKAQKAQADADSLANERKALQNQLKQAEAKALSAQQNADLVSSQRSALETQLKEAEDKLKQLQVNSGDAANQLSGLQAQLKQEQEKEQKAQANADSLTSERNSLQSQLKQAEAKALLAQQSADLSGSQRSALETQLKEAEDKLKQLQVNSGDAASQLSGLQAQLKQEQDRAQTAQADADFLANERKALQNQLKQAEAKALLAQQNANLASSQRSTLESQLKEAEEKLKQLQVNSGDATSQLSALQAQLKQEQEKEQKAQANADSLTGERNGLQNQLKQTEAKALLAQQNADLAGSQRSALETQLKEAEEKLKQVQANSGSAASQLSALQVQLKEEQEKDQKARANADSLTSERNALQGQLKATEEKLRQTQANSGDAASQLNDLQAQLKREQEKAQADADSLTSERNALQGQLKVSEEKLKQTQANSGDVTGQISALRAQLRQEQEKEQKAQASASSLASERNALRNQLKEAEANALLAQQNADLAGTQRSALETQLRETQEKLRQAEANSGDAPSQLRTLQARLYSPQQASPTPSLTTNISPTANAPESQATQNGETSGNVESLKEFVLGYLRTVASNDTSVQRRYFAERVSFYGRGVLDPSDLEASTEEYHREWPTREWAPRGEARIARLRHRDRFVVYQPFRWAVSDGSRRAQGNATLYLLIHRDSQGELRIVDVHELDR